MTKKTTRVDAPRDGRFRIAAAGRSPKSFTVSLFRADGTPGPVIDDVSERDATNAGLATLMNFAPERAAAVRHMDLNLLELIDRARTGDRGARLEAIRAIAACRARF
jgi:hypothetical protein